MNNNFDDFDDEDSQAEFEAMFPKYPGEAKTEKIIAGFYALSPNTTRNDEKDCEVVINDLTSILYREKGREVRFWRSGGLIRDAVSLQSIVIETPLQWNEGLYLEQCSKERLEEIKTNIRAALELRGSMCIFDIEHDKDAKPAVIN